MQNELFATATIGAADVHRVPRVGAALISRDDTRLRREHIHDLPLSLITPLGTNDDEAAIIFHFTIALVEWISGEECGWRPANATQRRSNVRTFGFGVRSSNVTENR